MTIRDVIDTYEASEKSNQAYDDQEYTVYSKQGYYDYPPLWGLLT